MVVLLANTYRESVPPQPRAALFNRRPHNQVICWPALVNGSKDSLYFLCLSLGYG